MDLLSIFQLDNTQIPRQIQCEDADSHRFEIDIARTPNSDLLHGWWQPEASIDAFPFEMDAAQTLGIEPLQERVCIDDEPRKSESPDGEAVTGSIHCQGE